MGRTNGAKDYEKQKTDQEILDRAKAESDFSNKLYDLMFDYQERLFTSGNKAWAKPLGEIERVGDLNLPLSRLYNQIWSIVIGFQKKAKPKKKQQQMEVTA